MNVVLILLNVLTLGVCYYLYIIVKELSKYIKEQEVQKELKVVNGDKEDDRTYDEYLNSISIEMEDGTEYKVDPKTKEYEEYKEAK